MTTTKEETKSTYWKISKFAALFNKHNNTIDGWFRKLEEESIHHLQRIGKEKVYDELDYEIAKYINIKREEGWTLDAIFETLRSGEAQLELRGQVVDSEDYATNLQLKQMENIKTEIFERLQNYDSVVKKLVAEEMHRKLLEDKEAERNKRFEDLITQRRIVERLKKEAKMKWHEKPIEEKYIKVGLLRKKVENIEKRNEFIEDYISLHFENELRNELGIEVQHESSK